MAEQQKEKELTPEEKKIEEIQKKIDGVTEKFEVEMRSIEKKYSTEKNPLLKERSEAIKAIPDFWQKTLLHHLVIYEELNDDDMEILKHLEDLHIEELFEELDGYTLTLHFKDSNPYFSNDKVFKTFRYNKEKENYVLESSKIEWKEGKNLAEKNQQLEKDEKEAEESGTFTDDEREYSWFGFWERPLEDGEEDDVADAIREDLWAQPFKYFTTNSLIEDLTQE